MIVATKTTDCLHFSELILYINCHNATKLNLSQLYNHYSLVSSASSHYRKYNCCIDFVLFIYIKNLLY